MKTTRDRRLAEFKDEGRLALGVEQDQLTTCEAHWYLDSGDARSP